MHISPEVRNAIHVGDRILEINGLPVSALMEEEVLSIFNTIMLAISFEVRWNCANVNLLKQCDNTEERHGKHLEHKLILNLVPAHTMTLLSYHDNYFNLVMNWIYTTP